MERSIKLAYVSMTRLRELLCIAMSQDSLNEEGKNIFMRKREKFLSTGGSA